MKQRSDRGRTLPDSLANNLLFLSMLPLLILIPIVNIWVLFFLPISGVGAYRSIARRPDLYRGRWLAIIFVSLPILMAAFAIGLFLSLSGSM